MQASMDWVAANDRSAATTPTAPEEVRPAPAGAPRWPDVAAERREDRLVAASRVVGAVVFTAGGERLGRIAEIALDGEEGRALFVVVVAGGFLGFGERVSRVPWSNLRYASEFGGYVAQAEAV